MFYDIKICCTLVALKKVLYIFFAVYFLGLSVIPCNDEPAEKISVLTSHISENEHHEHENEACTPFCVCSCCTTHILHANENNTTTILNEVVTVYTQPNTSKLPTTVTPIWQPPKLFC